MIPPQPCCNNPLQQSPLQPARCMWPLRAGLPMNSSWTQTPIQRGGGGVNNGSVKENELLHVLQETNHQTHGLHRTEGAKLELKTSSVSRNLCGTLTVKIFVWPAFNLLCVQEFFRPSVGASLEQIKQTAWWFKVFCQVWNNQMTQQTYNIKLCLKCTARAALSVKNFGYSQIIPSARTPEHFGM